MVTAMALEEEDMFKFVVQCDFITGSIAHGCIVEFGNITINLTKGNACTTVTVNKTQPPFINYTQLQVIGYDIESDDSIGKVPVPGLITRNKSATCTPLKNIPSDSNRELQIIIVFYLII